MFMNMEETKTSPILFLAGPTMLLLAIATLFFVVFSEIAQQSLFWYSGFALSIGLSFFITFLSLSKTDQSEPSSLTKEINDLKQENSHLSISSEKLSSDLELFRDLSENREKQIKTLEEQNKEQAKRVELQIKENLSLFQKKELEIQSLKNSLQVAQTQSDEITLKLRESEKLFSQHAGSEEKLASLIQEKKDLVKEAEEALSNLRTKLASKEKQNHQQMEEISALTEARQLLVKESDEALSSLRSKLAAKDTYCHEFEAKYAALSQECDAKTKQIEEIISRLNKNEIEKENLQNLVKSLELQTQVTVEPPSESKNHEALFRQLRTQFEEKKALVDTTRKELFHVTEELAAFRLNYEEERIYSRNPLIHALEKTLLKLGRDYESLEKRSREEVLSLQEIISLLTKR